MAGKTSAGDVAVQSNVNGPPNGEAPLEKGENEIPNITKGEIGYTGLTVLGGEILEECSRELRWPECIKTFKKMEKDGTIAPALELVEMMIARVPWHVKVPEGFEEELEQKAQFLRQNMDDMEGQEYFLYLSVTKEVYDKIYGKSIQIVVDTEDEGGA